MRAVVPCADTSTPRHAPGDNFMVNVIKLAHVGLNAPDLSKQAENNRA
jgi:hypothetical protein